MLRTCCITMCLFLGLFLGCDKNQEEPVEPQPTATETQPTEGTEAQPSEEVKTAQAEPETAPEPAPEAEGPGLSESKEMLGLDLKPIGKWNPVWDEEAKVVKFENPAVTKQIFVRLLEKQLETIDDLKAAAPEMEWLGSAITKVVGKPKKTKKGWWTVVKRKKETDFVYVQTHGEKQLVCSANLTKVKKGIIPQPIALKACESIKLKEAGTEDAKEDTEEGIQEKRPVKKLKKAMKKPAMKKPAKEIPEE